MHARMLKKEGRPVTSCFWLNSLAACAADAAAKRRRVSPRWPGLHVCHHACMHAYIIAYRPYFQGGGVTCRLGLCDHLVLLVNLFCLLVRPRHCGRCLSRTCQNEAMGYYSEITPWVRECPLPPLSLSQFLAISPLPSLYTPRHPSSPYITRHPLKPSDKLYSLPLCSPHATETCSGSLQFQHLLREVVLLIRLDCL